MLKVNPHSPALSSSQLYPPPLVSLAVYVVYVQKQVMRKLYLLGAMDYQPECWCFVPSLFTSYHLTHPTQPNPTPSRERLLAYPSKEAFGHGVSWVVDSTVEDFAYDDC